MIQLPHMPSVSLPKGEAATGNLKLLTLAPSILSIVVCLVVIGLVVWPKFNEVMKLRSENEQLKQRATALEEKASLLSGFSQQQLERQLVTAEKLLPSDKAVFSMVSQIEKAASSSGIILNKIDLVPGVINDDGSSDVQVNAGTVVGAQADLGSLGVTTPRIQVKVAITSDFRTAQIFLLKILNYQRSIAISDLTMSYSASGTGTALLSTMVVNAFWKPIPKELPAIETPVADITEEEKKVLSNVEKGFEASSSAAVPQVPLGRQDLFAPF